MTTETEIRFSNALKLSESRTLDTTKLSAFIDLVIPEDERDLLWKNMKEEGDQTKANMTMLNVIIFGYCHLGFHTELERDTTYIMCIKQLTSLNLHQLRVFFRWYTLIPTKKPSILG